MAEAGKPGRKWWKKLLYVLLAIVLVMVAVAPYALSWLREEARRISCASNLVSMGLAFKQYAMDYQNHFPNADGVAGFEMLRSDGFFLFRCPSTEPASDDGEKMLSSTYELKGGLKATPEYARRPLMWDKCGNHKNYCNVLFCDGHVEAISYKDGKLSSSKFFRKFKPGPDTHITVCPDLPPEILSALGANVP